MNKVKIEDIKALIPSLTDEDVNKLQQLFDRNFNSIVTNFENDIFDITRIPKKSGEKYFEYLKTAFGEYILANTNKTEIEEFKSKIKTLETEKMQLEDKIRAGATGKTKEDLEKLELQISTKDAKIQELLNQMKIASDKYEKETSDIHKAYSLNLRSIMVSQAKDKYKIENEAINDNLRNVIYRDLESKLGEYDIKMENGIPILYKDGQQQYNPKNPLEVYSLDSFYLNELEPYGIKKVTAIPGQPDTQKGTGIIAGAKTKGEAHIMITKHLESKGITKNSENYNSEFTKIAKETGAFEMPQE